MSIIFFDHFDPTTGDELWLNSGNITKLVTDINPGPGWSNPENLTQVGGTLFFTAYDDSNGYQLWKTDGTAAGTVKLTSVAPSQGGPFSGFVNANGTLFFEANDGTHGWQLWKSDGSAAGTVMVTNFSQGVPTYVPPPLAVGSTVFFTAPDSTGNLQIWKSDGTATGTTQLTNDPGISMWSSTVVGTTLYFIGSDGMHGNQLWQSNGTQSGTVMLTSGGGGNGLDANSLINMNGTLYFGANDGNGPEIWKSDGTANGTVMVANLYANNGTVPSDLTVVNGMVFFIATDNLHATQLWKSDGTTAGTVPVTDIGAPGGGFDLQDLTSFNGELYFFANDGFEGWQLWKSDGTTAGTVMVTNITGLQPTGNNSDFNPTVVNGTLYFESGHQLWKSDGTSSGTVLVENNVDTSQPIASLIGQLTQPTVASVTASPQIGAFGTGKEIALTVGFSEAVTVSGGTPTLLLNDGGTATYDPVATAALNDPTKTVFDYTVGSGQNTAGLAITGIVNGADIADSGGSPADFSSLPTSFNGLLVDTTPPNVAITSEVSTGDDGQLTLTGTISDNIDTPTITIFDGSTSLGTATINGTNWTFAATLGQGTHQLSATAVDQAGNSSTVNAPQPVTVNDVATAPTLSGPPSVTWTQGTASVSLPISVSGGDADDLATTTVTIKGLASGATITDALDGKSFSSSTVTLTAAEVNSGLTLHPGKLTSGTLTITASMTEGGGSATSAPLTISLKDPPSSVSSNEPSDHWFRSGLQDGEHSGPDDVLWRPLTNNLPPSNSVHAGDILYPRTTLLHGEFDALLADDGGKLTAHSSDGSARTLFSQSSPR
jgi:ELWxxDGT repeat protein